MASKVWSALNSNLAILIMGFLLTGVVGAWLSDRFQEASWRRQAEFEAERRAFEWEREKTFELLRHRLGEGLASLERVSDTMNRRLFGMERAFSAARSPSGVGSALWGEYMESVDEWNIKLKYYEEDLKRLVGNEFASELNDYETDAGCPAEPRSIHGKFFCAHRALTRLRECNGCPERANLAKETAQSIRDLNFQTDAFVARAGDVFLDRSAELEGFKFEP